MLLTGLFPGTQGLHMSVSSPWQIWMGAIWRRTQNSIVYRMNHHIPKYLGVCKIKNQILWGLPQSQPPKLNHVLTISWAAQTTTLANNPRLEHIKSWIRTFPAHFMCWSWTYVICVCTLSDGQMYFQQKKCVLHFGRALTQNSRICPIMSYLWMVGLVMRLFSCWANLWRSSACIQPKKVQPLGIYFWHLRLGLFKSPFLVGEAEHMWLQPFARTNLFSAKNICFALWARIDTKFLNLSHHVLSVDGWPGDATFFLWGQPFKIIRMYSAKKGLAPWTLFLTPAPRPLQVTLFAWWSWTYVVAAFC